jgi:acetyl esterase/lipase
VLLAGCALAAAQPQTRLLWPQGAPGALGSEDADKPGLTIYLPSQDRANGTAVVVCPGGGYARLATDHEGRQIAEWLNARGIAAFVLKYRLGPRYRHPAMLQDVRRAVRTVRARAGEFGVAPNRIGVWGFSAGGHLASTAGTHFDPGDAASGDPIERVSSRPDFLILAYPVITMDERYTHKGSRLNLLGENPDPKLVEDLSNDQRVTGQTPPAFLFHTSDDPVVPVENSVRFYQALRKAGVPAEMHIYEHGKHGLGLAQQEPALSTWPSLLENWLKSRGLISK